MVLREASVGAMMLQACGAASVGGVGVLRGAPVPLLRVEHWHSEWNTGAPRGLDSALRGTWLQVGRVSP